MEEWKYMEDMLLEYWFPVSVNYWCGTDIDLAEWQKKCEDPVERKKLKRIMDNFDWSPLDDLNSEE